MNQLIRQSITQPSNIRISLIISTTQLWDFTGLKHRMFVFLSEIIFVKIAGTKEASCYMGIMVWRYDLLTSHSEPKLSITPCNYRELQGVFCQQARINTHIHKHTQHISADLKDTNTHGTLSAEPTVNASG